MAASRPIFDPDRMAAAEEAALVPRSMTVSQLSTMIRRVLSDALPTTIYLVGEISNIARPDSGHVYLTLKDQQSEIKSVVWRSTVATLKFNPTDGMEVIATGSVEVYTPRGQYQFVIRKLEPRGVGALELAFRQLQERLAKEGLFEKAHKKRIPAYPRRIAVVTSNTGAAIQDILKTLGRRFPCLHILVHPTKVQGEGAAEEIAAAISRLNEHREALGGIDVMIVARGGGSLEDLWAFNEEPVARAIFASRIPVISGVGHEVDVTISDLVADLRAPTPTAAAEMAVPVLTDVLDTLAKHESRLRQAMRHRLEQTRSRLTALQRIEWLRDPMSFVHRAEQHLDEICSRLELCCSQYLNRVHRRLHELEIRLAAVQPAAVLRGQHARVDRLSHQLDRSIQQRCRLTERRIAATERRLLSASPAQRLSIVGQQVDRFADLLQRSLNHRLQLAGRSVDNLAATLEATSYRRTLARGFTITRVADDRRIITRAEQVSAGQKILTETGAGEFESQVTKDESGR